MTIYARIISLTILAIANGLAALLAMLYIHPAFVALAFALPSAFGIALLAMKCPRCGYPVMKRRRRALGTTWTYWGGFWSPRSCTQCGLSFVDEYDPVTPGRETR